MAHDPLALLVHAGDAFATVFRHAPAFEARLTGHGWAVTTGEAHCFWNWACLATASPTAETALRDLVAALRARGQEGLVCYPADLEADLGPLVRDLGLDEPEDVPLMVIAPAELPPLGPTGLAIERVADSVALAEAATVMAAGFHIPVDQALRCLPAPLLVEPAVAFYLARRARDALGALALTRFGHSVSIDIMAVDPAAQRQGIGRALMLAAMHAQAADGATGFHLLSSPDGQRLYEQIGFTTLLATHVRFVPVTPIPVDRVVVRTTPTESP